MKAPSFFCLMLAAAQAALAGPDLAKEPASVDDKAVTLAAPDAAPSVLGIGVKSSNHFTEGSAFFVEPLWENLGRHGTMGGSIFFAEPYFSWGEEGEICASIGLGFRHLFSAQTQADALSRTSAGLLDEGFFVGANVFLDYMQTQSDSDLWQFGLGLEAGTRYIEVRGNYYIPLGDGERVDRFDFATLEPHLRGGLLTSITARTRTIDVIEEPMEGWDAEVAVLVPGIDKWFDMRLIGGYFEFYGAGGGALFSSADIGGWKAGVEVRPVPAVVLSAMWYEDEAFVDEHWIFGLRLEIPLGKPGSFTPRRRHLQERLVEPVHRQNASINVGVTTEQVGPTKVATINNAAEFNRFVAGSSGALIVLTSTGGGATVVQGGGVVTTGGSLTLTNNSSSATSVRQTNGLLVTGGSATFLPTLSFTIGSLSAPLTFPAVITFLSLQLTQDLFINGIAVPTGAYPVTNGSIDVGGTIIPLGGATVTN